MKYLDETQGKGKLAQTTTVSARVRQRVLARKRAEKQKASLEKLQRELDEKMASLEGRPTWDSSALFPYKCRHMNTGELPPLARMFKNPTFWGRQCNPKAKPSPRAVRLQRHAAEVEQRLRDYSRGRCCKMQSGEGGTPQLNGLIQAFTSNATKASREFRRLEKFNRPTPEPGGFYEPPAGPRKEFPELEKFFHGGKAEDLVRSFTRIPPRIK